MKKTSGFGFPIYVFMTIALSAYFTFAAVQGDLGVLKRVQIAAEVHELEAEKAALSIQVSELENKTRRLSDRYLDLDLLDEQARDILGLMRANEIAVR